MEMKMHKVLNAINLRKLVVNAFIVFIIPVSFGFSQNINAYHSIINEFLEFNDKGKIELLQEVDLSTAWIDYLEDTAFIHNAFRHVFTNESIEGLIAQINLSEAKELIKNTTKFTWERKKLNHTYKLRKKKSDKGLTYKYSIPIVDREICILRVKSFDSVSNIGDYIYIMNKNEKNQWITACIFIIHEMFPDYGY